MSYLFLMKQKSVQIRLMFNAFGHPLPFTGEGKKKGIWN